MSLSIFVLLLPCCLALGTVIEGVRVKRQAAPFFIQSSYNFTVSTCSNGTYVGRVRAVNPSNDELAYSVDGQSGSPQRVAVYYLTGQINLASAQSDSFNFNLRATNSYGSTVVPIRVSCGNNNLGLSQICYNGYCYPAATGSSNTVNSASTSTTYTFTTTSCSSGTYVGQVQYSGSTLYAISSGNGFAIQATDGNIYLSTALSAGTYTVLVNAYTSSSSITIIVIVTVACSGSSTLFTIGNGYTCFDGYCYGLNGTVRTTGNLNNGIVSVSSLGTVTSSATSTSGSTFVIGSSSSLSLSTSTCTAGSGAGTVVASGATGYSISNSIFSITSAGVISLTGATTAGTYSVTITAFTSTGSSTQTATITVNCGGTTTSTATGFNIDNTISTAGNCLYSNCNFTNVVPVFTQQPYSFALTSCSIGGTIGTVSATNAVSYYINTGAWSNYFLIGSSSGTISLVNSIPASSTTPIVFTVTAYNRNGVPSSVPVFVNCAATTTTVASVSVSTVASLSPFFPFTSYAFTVTTCTAGSTIGQLTAQNAATYAISGGSTQFSISSAGVITSTTALTTGSTGLTVTALSSTGVAVSVPVTVTATCTGTGVTVATTTVATTTTVASGTALQTTSCVAGSATTTRYTVANTLTYNINNGDTRFAIDSTGLITLQQTVAAGTYQLPISTFDNNGNLGPTVTVNVVVNCAVG